jgi:hypothetical protein
LQVITIDAPGPRMSDNERATLCDADVITGVDVQTEQEYTVFGTPALESTVSLKRPSAMRVVKVRIHDVANDLERLAALVKELKGPGA